MDLRRNAANLAADGGRGGCEEWIRYRRYVRLLPRHPADGSLWALVLQDACPWAAAERVLVEGVDVQSHQNLGKSEGVVSDQRLQPSDEALLVKGICAGHYVFSPDQGCVDISYTSGRGESRLKFRLGHDGPHKFADRLEWLQYELMETNGELITFDLGKLPDYRGGGLKDEGKDHFPFMDFRLNTALEHLL
jgi:hypothetical protein